MPRPWPACSRSAAASTPGCGRGSSGSRRSWRRSAAPSAAWRWSRSAAPTARARSQPSWPRCCGHRGGAAAVVAARAGAVGVPLWVEGQDLHAVVTTRDLGGQRVTFQGPGFALGGTRLALLGRFQAGNALLATAVAQRLGLPEAAIRAGLAGVRWPGRFQLLDGDPRLVLDGAHNPNGAEALAQALQEYFGDAPKTLVVGISADKDLGAILRALLPQAARLVLTRSSNGRAADPSLLRAALPPTPIRVDTAESVAQALELAAGSPRTPIICVPGSLFLVAELLELRAPPPRSSLRPRASGPSRRPP